MTTTPPERLDRIEAILEALALQSQKTDERLADLASQAKKTDERIDNLTKLVEKHERSRMAFRQYTKQIFEQFAHTDLRLEDMTRQANLRFERMSQELNRRHDETMSYLRGQQIEMRRLIDRVVGEKNFDED